MFKCKEMTDKELKEECHKLIDESNKIARKWNSMKMPFPDFVQVPEKPQKRLFFEKLFFWRKIK